MRFEDKEVDATELELLPELERDNELEKDDELEAPELDTTELLESSKEAVVLDAMRAILEKRTIEVDRLQLPQAELRALQALKAAVDGRDQELQQFVYAEDRQDLLEQALAILQPSLIEQLGKPFQDLIEKVGTLRTDLKDLEDGQDELLSSHHKGVADKSETDTADKPDPGDTSLDGPERTIAKPSSQLATGGPEATIPAFETTLSKGAEVKPPAYASQLSTGGPDAAIPPFESTLSKGKDVARTDAATTLGDPDEIAAAQATPRPAEVSAKPKPKWWKRAFGRE